MEVPMSLSKLPVLVFALLLPAACGDDDGASTDTSTGGDTQGGGDATATTTTDTRTGGDGSDSSGSGCDPVAQTGCADDKNCTFVGNESTSSCQDKGVVPPEEPCGGEDRCEVGVCLNLNQTKSLCYQFCGVDADCGAGAPSGACLTLTNAAFKICKIDGIYANCNLLTQDCAEEGKSCYAVANENDPICLTTGDKALGNACDRASECAEGLACVNDVCRTLCDPDAEGACGAGFACNPFFANAGYCEPE
jgi:hypothetical protein